MISKTRAKKVIDELEELKKNIEILKDENIKLQKELKTLDSKISEVRK